MSATTLDERITVTRRIPRISTEGEISVAEVPTFEQLVRHAERFGPNQVVETAILLGYPLDFCVRLQVRCDVLERVAYAKGHDGLTGSYTAPKSTPEDRVKKLMGPMTEVPAETPAPPADEE